MALTLSEVSHWPERWTQSHGLTLATGGTVLTRFDLVMPQFYYRPSRGYNFCRIVFSRTHLWPDTQTNRGGSREVKCRFTLVMSPHVWPKVTVLVGWPKKPALEKFRAGRQFSIWGKLGPQAACYLYAFSCPQISCREVTPDLLSTVLLSLRVFCPPMDADGWGHQSSQDPVWRREEVHPAGRGSCHSPCHPAPGSLSELQVQGDVWAPPPRTPLRGLGVTWSSLEPLCPQVLSSLFPAKRTIGDV